MGEAQTYVFFDCEATELTGNEGSLTYQVLPQTGFFILNFLPNTQNLLFYYFLFKEGKPQKKKFLH